MERIRRVHPLIPRNDAGVPLDQLNKFSKAILAKSRAKKTLLASSILLTPSLGAAIIGESAEIINLSTQVTSSPLLPALAIVGTAAACGITTLTIGSAAAVVKGYFDTKREAKRTADLDLTGRNSLLQKYRSHQNLSTLDWAMTLTILGGSAAVNLVPVPLVAQGLSLATAVTGTGLWFSIKHAAHLTGGHLLNREARAIRKDARRRGLK